MPTASFRASRYVTPPSQSEPDGVIFRQTPFTRSLTDFGASLSLSLNRTENWNQVAVVPVAGLTVPFSIVTSPQVLARAGAAANPNRDATSQPESARAPASLIRGCPRRSIPVPS